MKKLLKNNKMKNQVKLRKGVHQAKQKSLERRMTTEYIYSVFTTQLLRFLKKNDVESHDLSKELAKKNGISEEKNYSIIFLKMSFYFHRRIQEKLELSDAVQTLFGWLEERIDGCVLQKYRYHAVQFQNILKQKNRDILFTMKKVFQQGDLKDPLILKDLVINIYEKKGIQHTRTHERFASDLANLIVGVIAQGSQYLKKKLIKQSKIQDPQDYVMQQRIQSQQDQIYSNLSFNNSYPDLFQSLIVENDLLDDDSQVHFYQSAPQHFVCEINLKMMDQFDDFHSQNLNAFRLSSHQLHKDELQPLINQIMFEKHEQSGIIKMPAQPEVFSL